MNKSIICKRSLAVVGCLMLATVIGCDADFNHPQQIQLSDYPENETEAAKLYVSKCSGCHAAPLPTIHDAGQWPSIVRRMEMRMNNKAVQPPNAEETAIIIGYLQKHAKK